MAKRIYCVEGECEKALIDALKSNGMIVQGKCIVLNIVSDKITEQKLLILAQKQIYSLSMMLMLRQI